MKLRNLITGDTVVVYATTNHPQSSYGKAIWVDADNNALCQQGLEFVAGYEIVDQRRELGQRLRAIREEKELNKNHLMKRGMRIETINAIEEGSNNYTIDKLLEYADWIGVDITPQVI